MSVKILTLLIPTYNMEKYLNRCLSSLILQDEALMKQLEVLVINDGSTDRSSAIAHGYEARYPNTFQVIDKENGNYGSCINQGLNNATGKYIKILDADDWFDTAQFSRYLDTLDKVDVDAVFNDYVRVGKKETTERRGLHLTPYSLQDHKSLLADYENIWMHQVTYRTELLRKLCYRQTEGISYTDQEWIFIPMSAAQTIYYIPGILYFYLIGREDQTVNPNVFAQNFWMETTGLDVMLKDLELCQNHKGVRNDITINTDYLIARVCQRCRVVYRFVLFNKKNRAYCTYLKQLDFRLLTRFPEVYSITNEEFYPSTFESQYKWRVRYIKTWRNWGLYIYRLQLFFVQHYMGIVSRLHS